MCAALRATWLIDPNYARKAIVRHYRLKRIKFAYAVSLMKRWEEMTILLYARGVLAQIGSLIRRSRSVS